MAGRFFLGQSLDMTDFVCEQGYNEGQAAYSLSGKKEERYGHLSGLGISSQ